MPCNRRRFVSTIGFASAGLSAPWILRAAESPAFFTVRKQGSRWWFFTPEGRRFFSLALNHIDSAPLRHTEQGELWLKKYGNSTERWLKESVRRDLLDWGFNSVGWTQEVVVRGDLIHRHSPAFTFEEYQWLGLPYCHLLPFSEIHQWENETRLPDFSSRDFEDWCDCVARNTCARLAGDSKLIGYFYSDCPVWVHTRPPNAWRGPLFDPEKLKSEAGRKELYDLATRYYRVTHDAIRRYDKHHLILGDRYEANAPVAMEVINAAKPFVDVLSFQDFKDPAAHLAEWHARTDKPVLWADGSNGIRATDPVSGASYTRNNGAWYAKVLQGLRDCPGAVGAHLCGAYVRNRVRNRGLRDERDQPDEENITLIRKAHRATSDWVNGFK